VLLHERPTFQSVTHRPGRKFLIGLNFQKGYQPEPVNRSVRRGAQLLGISGAERELENVRPVDDGGGRGTQNQHSPGCMRALWGTGDLPVLQIANWDVNEGKAAAWRAPAARVSRIAAVVVAPP
jgi:hypothetical protein